jgi:hypothetical protein
MKVELSNVMTKYGAPMGRMNREVSGKCHLQEVPFDSGAYDKGGAYWGFGEPLYVCQDQDGNQFFVRAYNREQAKANVLEYNKTVTFYR